MVKDLILQLTELYHFITAGSTHHQYSLADYRAACRKLAEFRINSATCCSPVFVIMLFSIYDFASCLLLKISSLNLQHCLMS